MAKKPSSEYLADAKRLAWLFPSLKKYRRRKTLKPGEKAAISRATNIQRIVGDPRTGWTQNETRPEKYRGADEEGHPLPDAWTYPAFRKRSVKSYVEAAKRMAPIEETMIKYTRRKKLKPAEKSQIAYLEKRTRRLHDMQSLTKKQIKNLEKQGIDIRTKIRLKKYYAPGHKLTAEEKLQQEREAARPKRYKHLTGIKMRGIPAKTDPGVIRHSLTVTKSGLNVRATYETGVTRIYKFIHTGADRDAIIDAAYKLEAAGAIAIYMWTNHGRIGEGYRRGDMELMAAELGDEDAIENLGDPSIVRKYYAQLFNKADADELTEENNWIYGVIGLFETSE